MKNIEVEVSVVFLNIKVPFSILNGLCTGVQNWQCSIYRTASGFDIDNLEPTDATEIVFADNSLPEMKYASYVEWRDSVNKLFQCDFDDLVENQTYEKIDKDYILDIAGRDLYL